MGLERFDDVSILIKTVFEESTLTKTELAKKLKTSRPQLERIIRGENITLETLHKFAEACGRQVRIIIS